VRPFKKEDLSAFEPIEQGIKRFNDDLAQAIEDSDLSVTGIRNGKIAGCGGVHPIDDEQGELWLRLSKDCLNHKIDTLRWLREGFAIISEVFPFRQLNAVIRCGFEQSEKLVKYLGFAQVQSITQDGQKWNVFSKRVK
jgi:hypothetical protein